ncbi:MAG: hypothetical protein F6K48_35435 [Okeania sp. SIO3H1]|uniref:hypothetical protein n=1 Tax=Okeania sp. SIO1I7 TaxID=2607772 RepID=UPI0013CAC0BF|nr:hypothetical protein [Okeania sp. SIO1I7]NEN93890.1 hypothetical protein [Okeania sp. SIO3H1]NET25981.1 hypothetical protein [Okeania sp. SIO1I7]
MDNLNEYPKIIQALLENNDFWQKVAIAIISAFSVALFNYFSSNKQRQDQAMELSYTTNILSVLEFKKDIGQKNISILYGENYELADLYLISCDIENTGRKVIKNQEITFELLYTNVGILEQFFEPPLNDNSMGVKEIKIEDIKQDEVKKRYLIREILPKNQVGFRFLSGRRTQENEVPKLFVLNQDSSKVQLIPRTYKGERDEISRIMNFVSFLILFFTLPQILALIPDWGKTLAFLAKLVIFVFIIRDIGSFSKKIAELLILPFQISKNPRAKYNINIQDSKIEDSGISIGDIVRSSFKQERQKDEK